MDDLDLQDIRAEAKANVLSLLDQFMKDWIRRTVEREAIIGVSMMPPEVKKFLRPDIVDKVEQMKEKGGTL